MTQQVSEVIKQELLGPSFTNLGGCLRESIRSTIASVANNALDPDSCKLSPDWVSLDDPIARNQIITAKKTLEASADLFTQRHSESVKDAISAAYHRIPSTGQLRTLLADLVPLIINGSPSLIGVIMENPFPDAWMNVSHELALSAVKLYKPGNPGVSEWRRLNRLLLAEYFRGCILPNARLVQTALHSLSFTILGIRGCLVRIPGSIDRNGISDPPPPLFSSVSSSPSVGAGPSYGQWSDLLGHIDFESRNVQSRHGIVHRILDANRPVPTGSLIRISHDQMKAFRDRRFQEIELSIIRYMALSGIEQVLRAWASNTNLAHMNGSEPISWNDWKMQLPCSPALMTKLEILYNPDGPNLRNRIMHGGLLELESKRTESLLGALTEKQFTEIFPTIDQTNDHYSANNLTDLCLDCLRTLEQEIQTQGIVLTANDRSWESTMALSDDDIRFGLETYCDFLQNPETGEILRKRLFMFLGASMPIFSLCAQVGFHGWIRSQWSSDTLIQHMFLGLTFEGLYRLTAHLLGFSILQESNKGGLYRAKYRMLSCLSGGLCSDEIISRFVAHLLPEEQETAKKVLSLATKARDALAHGAIPSQTEERKFGEGHLFIKSIQLLQEAAVHHLKTEAAYFNWLRRNSNAGNEASELSDWVQAEDQITEQIIKYSR